MEWSSENSNDDNNTTIIVIVVIVIPIAFLTHPFLIRRNRDAERSQREVRSAESHKDYLWECSFRKNGEEDLPDGYSPPEGIADAGSSPPLKGRET